MPRFAKLAGWGDFSMFGDPRLDNNLSGAVRDESWFFAASTCPDEQVPILF
jgi:hypothetical protein